MSSENMLTELNTVLPVAKNRLTIRYMLSSTYAHKILQIIMYIYVTKPVVAVID